MDSNILTQPADELDDARLVGFMKRHQLHNLEEVLSYGVPDLRGMEGFDESVLRSLIDILRSAGAAHRLNQWPKR